MNTQQVITLQQKDRFGREYEFALHEGRELAISCKDKRVKLSYNIDLVALSPDTRRRFVWGWKWLIATIITIVLLGLLLLIVPYLVEQQSDAIRGVLFLSGLILVVSFLLLFFKHTYRQLSFYSRHAHIPLVNMFMGKPDKTRHKKFVQYLQQRINKLQEHLDLDIDKQLAGEMKMLRRLTEQGAITEQQYNQAKDKLFKLHQ